MSTADIVIGSAAKTLGTGAVTRQESPVAEPLKDIKLHDERNELKEIHPESVIKKKITKNYIQNDWTQTLQESKIIK